LNSPDPTRQRLAAILAADAAGYSRLMSLDEAGTLTALDGARAVFRSQIESCQGRVIDMAGDSVLAVFESASGAVRAAMAVQERLESLAEGVPADRRLRFRIGIHLGDVIEKTDGSVYGSGVNIAARLESLSQPGGITISDAVYGSVRRGIAASFDDLGEREVKNIAEPVRAFRVIAQAHGDAAPSTRRPRPAALALLARRWQVAVLTVSVLCLAGALAIYLALAARRDRPSSGQELLAAAGVSTFKFGPMQRDRVDASDAVAAAVPVAGADSAPTSPKWTSAVQVGGDDVYIDWSTLTASGDRRRVWAMVTLRNTSRREDRIAGGWPDGISSARSLTEFDCKKRRERTLEQTWFAGPMATGDVVPGGKGEPDWWERWAPGTADDMALRAVCDRRPPG
jgi:class 3 adenylate cyclase